MSTGFSVYNVDRKEGRDYIVDRKGGMLMGETLSYNVGLQLTQAEGKRALELRRTIGTLERLSVSAVIRRSFRFVLQELDAGRISTRDLDSVIWNPPEEAETAPIARPAGARRNAAKGARPPQ
jgi:hypothetical protein